MDEQIADLNKAVKKSLAPHFGKVADNHDKLAEHHQDKADAHKAMSEEHKKVAEGDDVHKAFHKTAASFHKTMAGHEEKCVKLHKALAEHYKKLEECSKELEETAKAIKVAPAVVPVVEVPIVENQGVIPAMDKSVVDPAPTPNPAPAVVPAPSIEEQVTAALTKAFSGPDFTAMIDRVIAAKIAERIPAPAVDPVTPPATEAKAFAVPRTLDKAVKAESPIDTKGVDPMFIGLCSFGE